MHGLGQKLVGRIGKAKLKEKNIGKFFFVWIWEWGRRWGIGSATFFTFFLEVPSCPVCQHVDGWKAEFCKNIGKFLPLSPRLDLSVGQEMRDGFNHSLPYWLAFNVVFVQIIQCICPNCKMYFIWSQKKIRFLYPRLDLSVGGPRDEGWAQPRPPLLGDQISSPGERKYYLKQKRIIFFIF